MKKASAKLRKKIKIKFCRELNRMNTKFASRGRFSKSKDSK